MMVEVEVEVEVEDVAVKGTLGFRAYTYRSGGKMVKVYQFPHLDGLCDVHVFGDMQMLGVPLLTAQLKAFEVLGVTSDSEERSGVTK